MEQGLAFCKMPSKRDEMNGYCLRQRQTKMEMYKQAKQVAVDSFISCF